MKLDDIILDDQNLKMGGRNYKVEKWKASLDTDLEEFCFKEGIYPCKKGNGMLNKIGGIIGQLYQENKARKINELMAIPKSEFLEYGDFYGKRKKAEDCWRTMNNVLKRHGYRMYVKAKKIEN